MLQGASDYITCILELYVYFRNYHVFYYLLQGASDVERHKLFLGKPEDYFYLNQVNREYSVSVF